MRRAFYEAWWFLPICGDGATVGANKMLQGPKGDGPGDPEQRVNEYLEPAPLAATIHLKAERDEPAPGRP
jgi:hypothetical protein